MSSHWHVKEGECEKEEKLANVSENEKNNGIVIMNRLLWGNDDDIKRCEDLG
jgi:hypothetical protein